MVALKHSAVLAAAAAIGLGSPAGAQTIEGGWEFRVSNVVSPSQPTATVEVWAWFDNVPGVSELWVAGVFDLVASDGEWTNFVFPLGLPNIGPGVRGSSIIRVNVGQLHLPTLGFFGDPANPIRVFAAEWRTTDFTPRSVSLDTTNTHWFWVVESQLGAGFQVWPNVIPGSGSIRVVPAPSLLLFPACALAVAQRRRRHPPAAPVCWAPWTCENIQVTE